MIKYELRISAKYTIIVIIKFIYFLKSINNKKYQRL